MAAAVATLTESTPGAIGMRTRRSTAPRAAALRPAPSAPSSRAIRSGAVGDEVGQRLVGVRAQGHER